VNRYTRPVPLDESFKVDEFSSGIEALDGWLRGRALKKPVAAGLPHLRVLPGGRS
jgi:hypothetical protein